MEQLDLSTMLFCSALQRFAFAALFLILWGFNRKAVYYLVWAIAAALWAAVMLAFFVQDNGGLVPDDVLRFGLGGLASVLIWVGLRLFDQRRVPLELIMLLVGAPCLAFTILLASGLSTAHALLPLYLLDGGMLLGMGAELLTPRGEMVPRLRRLAGVAGLLFGLGLLGTALMAMGGLADLGVTPPMAGRLALGLDLGAGGLMFIALLAMAGERAAARLERLALIDPQTGLFNRRGLESAFPRLLGLARRSRSPMGLLLIDLDHFKKINDRYGHRSGDLALLAFVQATLGVLKRQSDVAARYGGEEFVVLLPDTDMAGAHKVAEKLRNAVALHRVDSGDRSFHITVSIGITKVADDERDMVEALRRADKALYLAKSYGRNQVVAGPPGVAQEV